MPASIRSNTNASDCSKRSKCSVYRKLNSKSVVDENLFGNSNGLKKLQKNNVKDDCCEDNVKINVFQNLNCPTEIVHGKTEKIKVFSSDYVRNLIVPKENMNKKSIYLPSSEFDRLRERANFLTDAQIQDNKEIQKKKTKKLLNECQERKFVMKKADIARRVNERLNDLEEEAKLKSQYLLTKAMEQRQEEEDEIKMLNEQITNAKIQAIRDAQVLEKVQIKKEISDENYRLDNMMENDRIVAIKIQDAIDLRKKEGEMLGACEIMKQIATNEQDRLLQLEKMEQENAEVRRKMAKDMLAEMDRRQKKRDEQEKLRDDLNFANNQMMETRIREKEQDRLFDLKMLKEQQEKADREAALEAEQNRVRHEKELEIARLRGLQERASDEAAERDALRAKRAQEENERQWRKKELAAAMKLQADKDEMNRERMKLATNKEHLLAMEVSRDKYEFERILRAQKQMISKDNVEAKRKQEQRMEFCNGIRRQICEKEQERIAARNAFFEEGVRMEEEARLRRLRLEDAKNKKLKELRTVGIPEIYLTQIERKCGAVLKGKI